MAKPKSDPKGHSLRIYDYIFDSPAFAALSPYDVMAYLALLRELKAYNNGDLSLPLSRSKKCGIKHHLTLARSLRALCAVGLIAVTRRGGCTKGGQRLPNLYRLTDRDCYAIPAKHLEAQSETNEWRKVTTKRHGQELIQAAELEAKAKAEKLRSLRHAMTTTASLYDMVSPKTTASCNLWNPELGQVVTYGNKRANPALARLVSELQVFSSKVSHGTSHVSPLYVATPIGELDQASQNESVSDSFSRKAVNKLAPMNQQACDAEISKGATQKLNVSVDDLT